MDDFQKWLEAAAAIQEDIQYLKDSLSEPDLAALQTALAVYMNNARTGVRWPEPDDLYCIEQLAGGPQTEFATRTRTAYKLAC
jgi:hypothetical protein